MQIIKKAVCKLGHWLQVFIPSWNFFDKPGHRFELSFRTHSNQFNLKQQPDWSDWQLINTLYDRRPLQLFFNPYVTLQLVHRSIVERATITAMALPAESTCDFLQTNEYKQLYSLVLNHLEQNRVSSSVTVEFRVCAIAPNGSEHTEIIRSTQHEVA